MGAFRFDLFLSLIRAIFPRWDFFDRIAYHFDLEYETERDGSWERISFRRRFSLFHLFINTDLNEALAQMNLLDHFAHDVQSLDRPEDATSLTSYKLVSSLVGAKAPAAVSPPRFRLVAVSPTDRIVLFVSPRLRRGEDR